MTILKNILALVVGIIVGGIVNMGLIMIGPLLIPPPAGVDVANPGSIAESMHLFEAKHFMPPFVAHALGTLVGALCAYLIAASHRTAIAFIVGVVFFAGGIAASRMIPAPAWFIVLDLAVAYIPMAWIGATIGGRIKSR